MTSFRCLVLMLAAFVAGIGALHMSAIATPRTSCVNCDCGCQEGKPCDCCK